MAKLSSLYIVGRLISANCSSLLFTQPSSISCCSGETTKSDNTSNSSPFHLSHRENQTWFSQQPEELGAVSRQGKMEASLPEVFMFALPGSHSPWSLSVDTPSCHRSCQDSIPSLLGSQVVVGIKWNGAWYYTWRVRVSCYRFKKKKVKCNMNSADLCRYQPPWAAPVALEISLCFPLSFLLEVYWPQIWLRKGTLSLPDCGYSYETWLWWFAKLPVLIPAGWESECVPAFCKPSQKQVLQDAWQMPVPSSWSIGLRQIPARDLDSLASQAI